MWGSSLLKRLIFWLRWFVYAYGVFAALLITIHISSPDPHIDAFPASCGSNMFGCSRVAEMGSQATRGLKPLHLMTSVNVTRAAVEKYISEQAGGMVLLTKHGFVHGRFVSLVFGFADDFFVRVQCEDKPEGKSVAVVEAQGQLRIGKSDLGVNARRNKRFFEYLQSLELPSSGCV